MPVNIWFTEPKYVSYSAGLQKLDGWSKIIIHNPTLVPDSLPADVSPNSLWYKLYMDHCLRQGTVDIIITAPAIHGRLTDTTLYIRDCDTGELFTFNTYFVTSYIMERLSLQSILVIDLGGGK